MRPLVRNKTGFQGAGLGIANAGETVTFVTTAAAEPLIVEAVKRAMEERGVKVNVVPEYEMVGIAQGGRAGVSTESAALHLRAGLHGSGDLGRVELPGSRRDEDVAEGAPPGSRTTSCFRRAASCRRS